MPAPFLFTGLPVLLALLAYAVRRWPRAEQTLATATVALLALLALWLPLDQPLGLPGGPVLRSTMTVLGRAFEIGSGDRVALAFLFSQAGLLFAAATLARPGRFYLPAGLAALGLLAAVLFVRPFLFAALFLEMAAALTVFMLGDEDRPATRGALRFLVFMTVGMGFILLTGWLLEASAASPEDTSFILRAMALLGAGFAALLAIVPFHSWLPVVAQDAPPLAAAYAFTVMQQATAFLLFNFLRSYPWLGQNPTVDRALTLAGGGMALVGAVFAFGQRNFGRAMGYALMVDIGAVLLGLGLGTRAGVQATLSALALRGIALPLWAAGLSRLRRAAGGSDRFEDLSGLARRHPFASAAVVLGLLSLVGFPPLAGFQARWALLRLLAQIHPTAAILLLLGMVSVSLVCARGLNALVAPAEGARIVEGRAAMIFFGTGVVAMLVFGAFPQLLLRAVAGAAAAFTSLGP